MRPILRHLPLLLTLLIPLGLLAWFGSREFTRLEDRAETILAAEAHRFLNTEEQKVRLELQQRVHEWLWDSGIDALVANPEKSLVEASAQLGETPAILQVFLVNDEFRLVAPRSPIVRSPSLPLHRFPADQDSASRELLRADILRQMGDSEGAARCLEDYLARHSGSTDHLEGAAWAFFHLAALLDRAGDGDGAVYNYDGASLKAEAICDRAPTADAAAILALSAYRQAEINLSPKDMFRVLERICTGRLPYPEYVDDGLQNWLVAKIIEHIPPGSTHAARRDRALAHNEVRLAGRRFARDYDDHARRELRVAFEAGRLYEHRGAVYHTLSAPDKAPSLLALRPARLSESQRYPGARWVGLRLDLPALVGSSLSGNPTSAPGNIALAVQDPTGIPLFQNQADVRARRATALQFAPVVSPLAGIEFIAVPLTNPSQIQNAARNQAILILILIVVAAGGAFLLIRSVRRESELAEMKVQLLSRVSHELKTPLAVIKMYGETLGMGRTKNQEQVASFAGIISGEADRLTSMVERILDFSKMEAGTFNYDKEPADLGVLAEAIAEEYRPHLESKGVELRDQIEFGLDAEVDPRGFTSSLVNLLENALKYTPEDTPDRALDVAVTRRNGDAVLEVSDRGVGIPAGELERVFDDFYRASNAGEARGSGLGLSLVRHFAKNHGGRIEALHRDGGGTTMRLTLPLTPETPKQPTTDRA